MQNYLNAIDQKAYLNAFLGVYAEEALSQAQVIDKKIASGQSGKLAGLVVGIKDVFAHRNHPLQAASRMLQGFHSQYSATVIQRLIDEDAVIIGRQNCDEFGMGSSTENSAFGPVLNPIDPSRTPGGSSGGSAAAVAAGLCDLSLGSDTGGSVRQPAAFCGVYGLKPTYGRISRHGLVAYASSFDTVGILSNDIDDIACVLSVIAGPDTYDSTVSHQPVPAFQSSLNESRQFRVAVFKEAMQEEVLQTEVLSAMHKAIEILKSGGHQVDIVEFNLLDYLLPTYYILATAEASSNLSRYDGVRYGYRSDLAKDVASMYVRSRSEGLGKEVLRRIILGTFVLSSDYHDTYYTKAQKVRRLIRDKTIRLLKDYDVLLMPTTPTTAFKLGTRHQSPLTMYMADLFSVQANVTGLPAISFPFGKDQQGLPIGLQAMGKAFSEDSLLQFAKVLSVDR